MVKQSQTLKKIDVLLLVLFPVFAVGLSLFFRANFLTSILLFYGLPSLWFSLRTPNQVSKTLLFSLIVATPIGVIIDYIAMSDGAWSVPNTVFPFRLLGVVPIEDIIFGFFLIYSVVIFYEHFLDKGRHHLIDKRMKYLIWPIVIVLLAFLFVLSTKPEILSIHYAYLWLGSLIFIIPSATFLSVFPRLFSKYIKTASYFFLLAFMFEITGLQLHQWTFPGTHFIGWIEIFEYKFPFEEFVFWFAMSAISILSYYEFFDGDRK